MRMREATIWMEIGVNLELGIWFKVQMTRGRATFCGDLRLRSGHRYAFQGAMKKTYALLVIPGVMSGTMARV